MIVNTYSTYNVSLGVEKKIIDKEKIYFTVILCKYLFIEKKIKSASSKLVIWQNDRIKQIIFSVKIVHHTTHY